MIDINRKLKIAFIARASATATRASELRIVGIGNAISLICLFLFNDTFLCKQASQLAAIEEMEKLFKMSFHPNETLERHENKETATTN
jgi:hypothetical protein